MSLSNISKIKNIRSIIKWSIIFGGLFMSLHCLFRIFDLNVYIINLMFGMSILGYVVLMLATYLLGFCNNIRYLITYIFGVRCCIVYLLFFGFGAFMLPIRIVLFILGLILLFKTIKTC